MKKTAMMTELEKTFYEAEALERRLYDGRLSENTRNCIKSELLGLIEKMRILEGDSIAA